ncbi:MAG: hypothetical protein ABSA17_02225 [Rhabdochlamydiaceae bacterium]|jgi:hypothetical protein
MTTINDLNGDVLVYIGKLLEANPTHLTPVSRIFNKWIARGCYEELFARYQNCPLIKEYVDLVEGDNYKINTVKATYQRVVRLLTVSGIDKSKLNLNPLCLGDLIQTKLHPFLQSYCMVLDRIANDLPEAGRFQAAIQEMTLLQQAGEIRSWMLQNPQLLALITNLNLMQCDLHFLPPEIQLFSNLIKLIIGRNELTFLPTTIGNLPELRSLAIQSNNIESLPTSMKNLRLLTRFSMCGNPIKRLPNELKVIIPQMESLAIDPAVTFEDGTLVQSLQRPNPDACRRIAQFSYHAVEL